MMQAIQNAVMYAGVAVLMVIALIVTAANMGKAAMRAKRRMRRATLAMLALAVACTMFGRKGTVTVSDPYIMNAGSYLTNDVAHVALLEGCADWVRLTPHLTFADHPYDYALVNATNYDVMVAANFTPAPTVHTNGVWQMKGFTIPGTGKSAFPNTKVIKKETQ